MLAYHGMQESYKAHDEVAAVETQLTSLMKTSLPEDVGPQAKKIDDDLKKIGGVVPQGGGFGGGFGRGPADPNALKSFLDVNNDYNTLVSMMQVGMDMAPTPTQISTWESDCKNYNRTVEAWTAMKKQITDFNAVLAKDHLQELRLPSTNIGDPPCSFSAGPASMPANSKSTKSRDRK
jgi:hypothetical protein